MRKTKISILLLTGVIFTTLLIPAPAFATEKGSKPQISTSQPQINKKSMTTDEAIHIIENKYLSIDSNGKFLISSESIKEIPENILSELNKSIQFTNLNIVQDNLKLMKNSENKFNLEVQQKFKDSNYGIDVRRSKRSSEKNDFYKKYAYKFKFFWWGYAAWVNKTGTNLLVNGMESLRDTFGGLSIISGAIVPGITTIAAGIGYLAFNSLLTQTKNARDTTGSCITYCYGSPKNGQVYKVTSSW